jgi:hypothetical protein
MTLFKVGIIVSQWSFAIPPTPSKRKARAFALAFFALKSMKRH